MTLEPLVEATLHRRLLTKGIDHVEKCAGTGDRFGSLASVDRLPATSGLALSTDIHRVRWYVSKGPTADSCIAENCVLFGDLVSASKN